MRVLPDNQIRISVPAGLSQKKIEEILRRKSDWILKQIKCNNERRILCPPKKYVEGEIFRFLGEGYSLRILKGSGEISLRDHFLDLFIPENLPAEKQERHISYAIQHWYRLQAEKILTERVALYQNKIPAKAKQITVKNLRSRWGSCSARGRLNFNWKLVMAPLAVMDYVMVHELAHLVHLNHSRRFWSLVEGILPEFFEPKEWLRRHGHFLTLD